MSTESLDEIFAKESPEEFDIDYNGKKYHFKLRELPWLKVNKLLSKAARIEKGSVSISLDTWYEEYLVEALVEAPWPLAETRVALKRLGSKFGKKLEDHVPQPGSVGEDVDFFEEE